MNKILIYTLINLVAFIFVNLLIYLYLGWINFEWQNYASYSVNQRVHLSFAVFIFTSLIGMALNFSLMDYFEKKERTEK